MSRGRIKMMGLAKTSVMVAFWTAAANFRLIDAYDREEARRAANGGHVVSPRTPRRHRAVSIQYQLNASGTDPPKQPATATVKRLPKRPLLPCLEPPGSGPSSCILSHKLDICPGNRT